MGKTHQQMLDEKAWKFCQAGHKSHETEIVDTQLGKMLAYKTDLYMGFDGYCSGQDDISRTLKLYGVWEPAESAVVREILDAGDRRLPVYDVGAHTGWYSLMAAQAGYMVEAIEADPTNIQLLQKNAEMLGVTENINITELWVDEDSEPLTDLTETELVIIDIEGNDMQAVRILRDLFKKRKVKNAMIEISPCFNDKYPVMVNFIKSCGYEAYDLEGKKFADDYSTPQFNLVFRRA